MVIYSDFYGEKNVVFFNGCDDFSIRQILTARVTHRD